MIENKGREGGKEGKERCKRLQSIDNKRVERKSATQRALSSDHGAHRGRHPRAMRMVVKIKVLREEQFVTL
jgi:hypothetical protein